LLLCLDRYKGPSRYITILYPSLSSGGAEV
jgi:hypothetical protein